MRSRVFLWTLIPDTSGVTAIEYGLIAALIAVAAVVVMGTVGTNLSGVFSGRQQSLKIARTYGLGAYQSPPS